MFGQNTAIEITNVRNVYRKNENCWNVFFVKKDNKHVKKVE